MTIFFCSSCLSAKSEVSSPFPAVPPLRKDAPVKKGPFFCPAAPEPVRDLIFQSFYEDDDPSRSSVDKKRLKKYKKSSAGLYGFEEKLAVIANRYVAERGRDSTKAVCAQDWLDLWAGQGALLGEVNRSGELVRKWSLASISSIYAQIKDEPDLDVRKKARIESWIRVVAERVIEDFSKDTHRESRRNNHLYWTAWAVAVTSYALQDREMLNWALGKAKIGLDQIEEDGSLPLEMARGKRALLYHNFSVVPLVMTAEMASRNGIDLYSYDDGALHRLVAIVIEGIKNPERFERETGEKQDYKKSVLSPSGLAWLVPYEKRFPGLVAGRIPENTSRFASRRLGGDMTLLFGAEE